MDRSASPNELFQAQDQQQLGCRQHDQCNGRSRAASPGENPPMGPPARAFRASVGLSTRRTMGVCLGSVVCLSVSKRSQSNRGRVNSGLRGSPRWLQPVQAMPRRLHVVIFSHASGRREIVAFVNPFFGRSRRSFINIARSPMLVPGDPHGRYQANRTRRDCKRRPRLH